MVLVGMSRSSSVGVVGCPRCRGTYRRGEDDSRRLRRVVADADQAARDAADKVLVGADAGGVGAAVANAASQELVGAALLSGGCRSANALFEREGPCKRTRDGDGTHSAGRELGVALGGNGASQSEREDSGGELHDGGVAGVRRQRIVFVPGWLGKSRMQDQCPLLLYNLSSPLARPSQGPAPPQPPWDGVLLHLRDSVCTVNTAKPWQFPISSAQLDAKDLAGSGQPPQPSLIKSPWIYQISPAWRSSVLGSSACL